MTFGLENKKVALVGLDGDISDAYTPYLKKQGIKDIRVFSEIVKPETLLESDASLIHLTHNKQDINSVGSKLTCRTQSWLIYVGYAIRYVRN